MSTENEDACVCTECELVETIATLTADRDRARELLEQCAVERDEYKSQAALYRNDMMRVREERDDARAERDDWALMCRQHERMMHQAHEEKSEAFMAHEASGWRARALAAEGRVLQVETMIRKAYEENHRLSQDLAAATHNADYWKQAHDEHCDVPPPCRKTMEGKQ